MKKLTLILKAVLLAAILIACCGELAARKFVHPGINQSKADLDYMKQQVLAGKEPWKTAFENVKAKTPLDFEVKIERHIIRGPYNKPDIGASDLIKGAETAYNAALIWYVTGDKAYAKKAIEIIETWAPNIWDFDENDAKLLVGLTGHVWCNAAEILRYTDSGWTQKHTDDFTHMMIGVYYPVIRGYYPEANGNWDGANIQSIMAMAVFTDDEALFDDAVDHYLRGTNNGSIFKYIFPSGQCQESTRDQGHVQMGIREFTGAARIANTQGVKLLDAGDNRLALGYEYTAQFVGGGYPHCYGTISERAKGKSPMYDFAYNYYTAQGLEMPYTQKMVEATREMAGRPLLISFLAPTAPATPKGTPQISKVAFPAGARNLGNLPSDAVTVKPGESLQAAIDKTAGTGKWVLAAKGVHELGEPLVIPSGTKLAGEGLETILHCKPGVVRSVINADPDLHDVILQNFVLEGAASTETPSDPNSGRMGRALRSAPARAGIIFLSNAEGQMKNLNFINLTISNFTRNGLFVSGAGGVNVMNCNFSDNGSSVVPGPKLHHNILLAHTKGAVIRDSRIVTSPHGCGINLDHSSDVKIIGCEIARNEWYGIRLATCSDVTISECLIEGNSASAIVSEYLAPGSSDVTVSDNTIWYNKGYAIESYAAENLRYTGNRMVENGRGEQTHISSSKTLIINP